MTDSEGLFALFGIMFGLIVAELSLKMADAIDAHKERPIGILTPALAFLVLTDVTGIWLLFWAARNVLAVNWHVVFAGVLMSVVYFLAASLVFPRKRGGCRNLDNHYWSRKRFVAGGMLIANALITAALLSRATPAWNDWLFYFYFPAYLIALAGLMLSRSRRLDIVLLACAIGINLTSGSDLLPGSHWGAQIGLTFQPRDHAGPHPAE